MGLARLYLTPEALLGLLHGRYEVVTHGLPVDATMHACVYDEQRHCLVLVVEHASFTDVLPGHILPLLDSPAVRRLDTQEDAPCGS